MITGATIATAHPNATTGTARQETGPSRQVDHIKAIAGIGTPTNRDSSCDTL
jgi:hypothetical protein